MITEIRQPMFFNTPLGVGVALFLIDYGFAENTVWIIALGKDGKIKHFTSEQITLLKNSTWEINLPKNTA